MRAGAERAEVTVEQVVRELKLLGFSDIRKVVSWRNELVTRTEKGKDGEPVMVLMTDTSNSGSTWAASEANLRDHAVRLRKRRGRYCLRRSCEGYDQTSSSNQTDLQDF